MKLTVAEIAQVCHEVNRAYCLALGDKSQPEWASAEGWQVSSAKSGVEFHLKNPGAGPQGSHENWRKEKLAEGWKFGKVKDPKKKEHPCMVPFAELPKEQQAKDFLFRQVVHSLAAL